MHDVIDTYVRFRELLKSRSDPLDAWVDYVSEYPALLRVLKDIAGDAFTYLVGGAVGRLKELANAMDEVHEVALSVVDGVLKSFSNVWGTDFGTYLVIYVGFGLGAVLPTRYMGRYAVMFDVLGAAEADLGREGIEEALTHGLCHVAHMALMGVDPLEYNSFRRDPLFLLYAEGFATRCECLVLGRHPVTVPSSAEVCELAKVIRLRGLCHESVLDTFGYSKDDGVRKGGYYLGLKIVKDLEELLGGIEGLAKLSFSEARELVRQRIDEILRSGGGSTNP